jgi:hypothetical protein
MVPSEGVRAGVHVADEVEGGGVALFRRPLVRERKAVKSAWVEERRSGVRGTWSDGGDMRLGVAEGIRLGVGYTVPDYFYTGQKRELQEWRKRIESIMGADGRGGGAVGAHLLSLSRGREGGYEEGRRRLTHCSGTSWWRARQEKGRAPSRHMIDATENRRRGSGALYLDPCPRQSSR